MAPLSNAERQQLLRDRRALKRARQALEPPGIEDMRRHVEALCLKLGLQRTGKMFEHRGGDNYVIAPHVPKMLGAHAYPEDFVVALPAVRSARAYAVALHEIGHLLGRAQQASAIQREVAAWLWARKHALVWSNSMAELARRSLNSYSTSWGPESRRHHPGSRVRLDPAPYRPATG